MIGPAVIGVAGLDPVGRDLDLVVAGSDHHGTEAIGVERLREELLDPFRRRVGRDIPVLWIDAADRVAHAAADHVGRVPRVLERRDDLLDVPWDPQFGDGHGTESRGCSDIRLPPRGHSTPRYAFRTISFSARFFALSDSTMRPVCRT